MICRNCKTVEEVVLGFTGDSLVGDELAMIGTVNKRRPMFWHERPVDGSCRGQSSLIYNTRKLGQKNR